MILQGRDAHDPVRALQKVQALDILRFKIGKGVDCQIFALGVESRALGVKRQKRHQGHRFAQI